MRGAQEPRLPSRDPGGTQVKNAVINTGSGGRGRLFPSSICVFLSLF